MNIKGHTKIELTDINTGEQKIYENDNLVTRAPTILANMLSLKPNSGVYDILPMYDILFGGMYILEQPVDVNAITLPGDNTVIGLGARNFLYNGVNAQLGNFLASSSFVSGNTITYVYEFSSEKANGQISSICLGDKFAAKGRIFGRTDSDNTLETDASVCSPSNRCVYKNWDGAIQYARLFEYIPDSGYSIVVQASNTTQKVGIELWDTKARNISITSTKDGNGFIPPVQLERLDLAYSGYCRSFYTTFYGTNWAIYASSVDYNNRKVYIAKGTSCAAGANMTFLEITIPANNLTNITHREITIKNNTNGTIDFGTDDGRLSHKKCFYIKGNELYLYSVSNSKCYKVDMTTAVATEITNPFAGTALHVMYSLGDFVYLSASSSNPNYVHNTVKNIILKSNISNRYFEQEFRNTIKGYEGLVGFMCDSSTNGYNEVITFCRGYLSTINNLEVPVVKTATQAMKITYTLTIT